jgi:hypothetical protein
MAQNQSLSFYLGNCDICHKNDILCASVTTCNGEYGSVSFCRPCINRKFDENNTLISEKNTQNKRPKLN